MNDKPETKELQSAVFAKIEAAKLTPRARWYFQSRECLVWFLWLLSVFLGALAVAVSLSAVSYQSHALYEITHDSYWLYVLAVLPYLWLLVFLVMGGLGIYHLRHTRRGYRYPLWLICASSLIFSLAGGAFLHLVGAGFGLDKTLGEKVPMYASQMEYERARWQVPNEGRLIGRMPQPRNEDSASIVWFVDADNNDWQIDISELMLEDQELLNRGQTVRLIGQLVMAEERLFHSCAVMPFVYEHNYTMAELREIRSSILRRLYSKNPKQSEEKELGEDTVCANLPLLKRLKPVY